MNRQDKMLAAMRNDTPHRLVAAGCAVFCLACGSYLFVLVRDWMLVDDPVPGHAHLDTFMTIGLVLSCILQLFGSVVLIMFALVGAPRQKLLADLWDRVAQLEKNIAMKESEPKIRQVSSESAPSESPDEPSM